MAGPEGASELEDALAESWRVALRLPDDEASFASLSPAQRRRAHDLGVRLQDRITRTLSRLVLGMAEDGADLVDGSGLPRGLRSSKPSGPHGEGS